MEENERQPPTSEQLRKLACDLLSHDKVMARCVLGADQRALDDSEDFDDLREKRGPLIEWMGNLITIAGVFLYSKFNQWRSETGANLENPNQPNALYLKRLLSGVKSANAYFDHASSGLRVLRVLDGLYDSFDLNLNVIKYIIINSQIEAGFNLDKKKGLSKLIGFPHDDSFYVMCAPKNFEDKKGHNLAKAFSLISLYRNDPLLNNNIQTKQYNIDDIECAFEDVFKAMKFMKDVNLEIDGEGNINFKFDGNTIPSYGVAKVFETKKSKCSGVYKSGMDLPKNFIIGFYFLEKTKYEPNPNKHSIPASISFTYQAFDENDSVQVYLTEKDGFVPEDCKFEIMLEEKSAVECYKKISGYLPGLRSASSFYRGMINMNFRFHNMLAPSIVDAIDKNKVAKRKILREFVEIEGTPFKEAFERIFKTLYFAFGKEFSDGCDDWKSKINKLCEQINDNFIYIIDWDTLLARILLYEGPSELIKAVLLPKPEGSGYDDNDKRTITEVGNQIIAGLEMRYIDNIFEAQEVSDDQEKDYQKNRNIIEKYKKYIPEYAEKMTCIILAQSYTETIVNTLTNISDNNDGKEINNREKHQKAKFAENNIQETIEILRTCNSDKNLTYVAYKAFLNIIIAFLSFYAGIKRSCSERMKYEFNKSTAILERNKIKLAQIEIEKEFLTGALNEAKELAKEFKNADEVAVKIALKKLLEFSDMSSKNVKIYDAVLARAPINKYKLEEIFKKVDGNIIFKDSNYIDFEQAIEKNKLIGYLGKIVNFLIDNHNEDEDNKDCDKENYSGYKELAKKIVYPQIVTYAKVRKNGDANDCLIMDHAGPFAQWHGGEVQILTEFEYDINNSYYALPNINRIDVGWWVDPILIFCHDFDKVISEAMSEV